MANLQAAEERLQKALTRLENIIAKRTNGGGPELTAMAGELAALKSEHQRLAAALRDAEDGYAALRQVTNTVSTRLDATIGELGSLLDE